MKVVIVEDSAVVRRALRAMIADINGVDQGASLDTAITAAPALTGTFLIGMRNYSGGPIYTNGTIDDVMI